MLSVSWWIWDYLLAKTVFLFMILKKIHCKILVWLHMAVAINIGWKEENMGTQLDVVAHHWENIK